MGQRKHKKRAHGESFHCEGGHYMVVVQEADAEPRDIYDQYVVIDVSSKEKAEEDFLARLFDGEYPNGSSAFIYELNFVSMVGGQRPQP